MFLACHQNQSRARVDEQFHLEAKEKGFTTGEYNTWEYFFTGSILNKSGHTYGKGTLFLSVVFEFENGNTVTDMQMNEDNRLGFFLGVEAVESLDVVEDGEKINMDKMASAPIKKQYRDYPLRAVYAEYRLELLDEINNEETERIIKREDITKAWREFVSNAK